MDSYKIFNPLLSISLVCASGLGTGAGRSVLEGEEKQRQGIFLPQGPSNMLWV